MAWERAHTVFHESLEAGIVDHHGRQAALSFDHHLGLLRSELKNRDESARTHAAELAATARAWAPLVPTS